MFEHYNVMIIKHYNIINIVIIIVLLCNFKYINVTQIIPIKKIRQFCSTLISNTWNIYAGIYWG